MQLFQAWQPIVHRIPAATNRRIAMVCRIYRWMLVEGILWVRERHNVFGNSRYEPSGQTHHMITHYPYWKDWTRYSDWNIIGKWKRKLVSKHLCRPLGVCMRVCVCACVRVYHGRAHVRAYVFNLCISTINRVFFLSVRAEWEQYFLVVLVVSSTRQGSVR